MPSQPVRAWCGHPQAAPPPLSGFPSVGQGKWLQLPGTDVWGREGSDLGYLGPFRIPFEELFSAPSTHVLPPLPALNVPQALCGTPDLCLPPWHLLLSAPQLVSRTHYHRRQHGPMPRTSGWGAGLLDSMPGLLALACCRSLGWSCPCPCLSFPTIRMGLRCMCAKRPEIYGAHGACCRLSPKAARAGSSAWGVAQCGV